MIVVDSSALVAILWREAGFPDLVRAIQMADERLMSSVSLLETALVLAGRTSRQDEWPELQAFIRRASIEVVAHDEALTVIARQAFLTYGKGRHPAALNMGDCATYALAKSRGAHLLYKGQDFSRTDLLGAVPTAW